MKKTRIFIADDHETLRVGLKIILNAQAEFEVCGEAANGREAVRRAQELKPDIVLMDISMPELNGLIATAQLKRIAPEIAIIILTRHSDEAYLQELLKAGASGYVLKQSPADELIRSIRAVVAGDIYLDPSVTGKFFRNYLNPNKKPQGEIHGGLLTLREEEVMRLVAWGFSNKEIADKLDISVKTVETHKANLQHKLNLHRRNDIVRFAILQGWLKED